MNGDRMVVISAFAAAALGIAGLAALAIPAGAGEQPSLPDIAAEELLSSALESEPPAMSGTVTVDNALGLPKLPGFPQLGTDEFTVRVWSDGNDRSRVSLPSANGERTLINDGTTLWSWHSASRTATQVSTHAPGMRPKALDPATVAQDVIGMVKTSSSVTVDGTARVSGRPAYELVLAPAPAERTLLREIRVAVDAEYRLPVRLILLAHGSSDPVLSVGFTELYVGAQDPSLFQFTPPAGSTVTEATPDDPGSPSRVASAEPTVVGDGWEIVLLGRLPDGLLDGSARDEKPDGPWGRRPDIDPRVLLERIGTPASGPWGDGTLITTAVVSAIVTSDGRVAAGAVPQQVLTEALSR